MKQSKFRIRFMWKILLSSCLLHLEFISFIKAEGNNISKYHSRWTRRVRYCWRSKDEFTGDVLLWTPTHGCAVLSGPARTYISSLWTLDLAWRICWEWWMIGTDGENARESGKFMLSATVNNSVSPYSSKQSFTDTKFIYHSGWV